MFVPSIFVSRSDFHFIVMYYTHYDNVSLLVGVCLFLITLLFLLLFFRAKLDALKCVWLQAFFSHYCDKKKLSGIWLGLKKCVSLSLLYSLPVTLAAQASMDTAATLMRIVFVHICFVHIQHASFMLWNILFYFFACEFHPKKWVNIVYIVGSGCYTKKTKWIYYYSR